MAKKMNKSAWVRSQPSTLSAAAIVSKAKAAGIQITDKYVYRVRSLANAKTKKTARTGGGAEVSIALKRGPGRPRRVHAQGGSNSAGGLEAAIERLVEQKVNELLQQKLGALFG